jgi:hypothetical protein
MKVVAPEVAVEVVVTDVGAELAAVSVRRLASVSASTAKADPARWIQAPAKCRRHSMGQARRHPGLNQGKNVRHVIPNEVAVVVAVVAAAASESTASSRPVPLNAMSFGPTCAMSVVPNVPVGLTPTLLTSPLTRSVKKPTAPMS